nr:hypothetical protein [Tanacetum cinerariifolium]
MVMVPIHQDTSLVPPMTTLVLDLKTSQSNSPTVNAPHLPSTSTTTTITTTTLPPPQPQQGTTNPTLLQRIGKLEQLMANLIQDNLALEERLDKHGSRLYNLGNLNIPQKVNPESDQVRIDVSRPLPLGGPPGHVTIQIQFFFNKDLDHLRYGNKGSRPALSISKMKAAHYPDFGLKLLVPEQMWIDEVCTYEISAAYGISHWWFNRQKFYIERHDSSSHRREVRKHMRILSVIKIKAFSIYGYDYLSKIVL